MVGPAHCCCGVRVMVLELMPPQALLTLTQKLFVVVIGGVWYVLFVSPEIGFDVSSF